MARPSALRSLCGALAAPLIAVALIGVLTLAGLLTRVDRAWFDYLQRTLAAHAPLPDDTALVLIDEESLTFMGSDPYAMRWPWPRTAFASLFTGLHRAGAHRIVVDLIFFENSEAEGDALLGAVAAALPEVTLGATRDPRTGRIQAPMFWPPGFREEHGTLFARRDRWGFVNSHPDEDGVIRAYPRGGSLVDAAYGREWNGAPPVSALMRWRGNLETLRDRGVPVLAAYPFVDAGYRILAPALEVVPDLDPAALAGAIDTQPAPHGEHFDAVRGRTVFVGVNAKGTFDAVATPVGAPEPGVLTHWTAWADTQAADFLTDTGHYASLGALALVVVLITLYGRGGVGLLRPGLATLLSALLLVAGSAAAFHFGVWFAPSAAVIGGATAFSAVAVRSFALERARKREIQGWFGSYVSPAVVSRLVQNPESLKLGGDRRELTVYFSDLAGFTTLSEKMPAEQLVALVNTFLEHLSESVLKHGCYLDKYIGDAIMAVFGSPEELENHALAACRAALDSCAALADLNDRIEREHGVRLGMRIGVNTGEMIVGNVGSSKKRNYTVLGDAVNLASRLEGANKEFGTSILIGPRTAALAGSAVLTRPVARLRVKGKEEAVDVFELMADASSASEQDRQFVASFTEGYEAWCARRFGRAVRAWEEAGYLRPDDALTARYLAEARRWSATPPPGDWEPVLKLESK